MDSFFGLQENDILINVNDRKEWRIKFKNYLGSKEKVKCITKGVETRALFELNPKDWEYIGSKP